jgi:hypothetical protein
MKVNTFPKDIYISLKVTMSDIYHRKFKKLNVKVKKWVNNDFIISSEIVYIDISKCLDYETKFVFDNLGDASMFRALNRSNIIITVHHIPDENIYISEEFEMLSISIDVSLEEFNNNSTFKIDQLHIDVPNMNKTSYIVPEMGLFKNDNTRAPLLVRVNII